MTFNCLILRGLIHSFTQYFTWWHAIMQHICVLTSWFQANPALPVFSIIRIRPVLVTLVSQILQNILYMVCYFTWLNHQQPSQWIIKVYLSLLKQWFAIMPLKTVHVMIWHLSKNWTLPSWLLIHVIVGCNRLNNK